MLQFGKSSPSPACLISGQRGGFHSHGGSPNRWYRKMRLKFGLRFDDLGVPSFEETSKYNSVPGFMRIILNFELQTSLHSFAKFDRLRVDGKTIITAG